jgi:hypothetical protein
MSPTSLDEKQHLERISIQTDTVEHDLRASERSSSTPHDRLEAIEHLYNRLGCIERLFIACYTSNVCVAMLTTIAWYRDAVDD